jgi:hypothetical protein
MTEVAQRTSLFRLEVVVREPNGDNIARGITTTTIIIIMAFLESLTRRRRTSSVPPLPLAFVQRPISHKIGLYNL